MLKLLVVGCIVLSIPLAVIGCMSNNPKSGENIEDKDIADSSFGGVEESMSKSESDSIKEEAASKAEYCRISAEEAKEIMDSNSEAIILDVRTEEEFREARISGAVLLPDFELRDRAADVLPDKDSLILIYCRSGNRSRSAAYELVDMGYTNVYDFGGINTWEYSTERN